MIQLKKNGWVDNILRKSKLFVRVSPINDSLTRVKIRKDGKKLLEVFNLNQRTAEKNDGYVYYISMPKEELSASTLCLRTGDWGFFINLTPEMIIEDDKEVWV